MSISFNSAFPSSRLSYQATRITQTYTLARSARRKLAREASRPDLHLGRLVGHANLLDSLMIELGRAEREQQLQQQRLMAMERNLCKTEDTRHIQWADCVDESELFVVSEHIQTSDDESSSDSDSEYDDNEVIPEKESGEQDYYNDNEEEDEDEEAVEINVEMEADMVSLHRVSSHTLHTPAAISIPHHYHTTKKVNVVNSRCDEEEFEVLELEYAQSHSYPPELDHDSDSSDDEAMPPSPPADVLPPSFFEKTSSNSLYSNIEDPSSTEITSTETDVVFDKDGYYLPQNTTTTTPIYGYSVIVLNSSV